MALRRINVFTRYKCHTTAIAALTFPSVCVRLIQHNNGEDGQCAIVPQRRRLGRPKNSPMTDGFPPTMIRRPVGITKPSVRTKHANHLSIVAPRGSRWIPPVRRAVGYSTPRNACHALTVWLQRFLPSMPPDNGTSDAIDTAGMRYVCARSSRTYALRLGEEFTDVHSAGFWAGTPGASTK